MTSDEILRQKVREAIRAGRLPNRRPTATWAGQGSGAPCTICSEPMTCDEVELELEFTPRGHNGAELELDGGGAGNGGVVVPRVHFRCLTAWERERSTSDGTRGDVVAVPSTEAP